MDAAEIEDYVRRLGKAADNSERRTLLIRAAARLDPAHAEKYERAATNLAMAVDGMVDLARDTLKSEGFTPDQRFFFFTLGAIRCRRTRNRAESRSWFEDADDDMRARPFFGHLQALTYGTTLRELRLALRMERAALEHLRPFAGAAHAIAEFLLLIAHETEDEDEAESSLEEALEYVDEAIKDRPGYARFLYTRGRIHRRRRDYRAARDALTEAIDSESRDSPDADERLRDYRVELALVRVDRSIAGQAKEEAARATAGIETNVAELESRVQRIRDSEATLIAAVGFVASAIGLVQVAARGFGGKPFYEVIAIVAAFGIILFGAVAFGVSRLQRRTG